MHVREVDNSQSCVTRSTNQTVVGVEVAALQAVSRFCPLYYNELAYRNWQAGVFWQPPSCPQPVDSNGAAFS